MRIGHERLLDLIGKIFAAAGCEAEEHRRIAFYLVESNLVGHDSHGVIRVPSYIQWLRDGKVVANQHLDVVLEADVFAVADGRFGFGQVIGEEATELGVALCRKRGVSVVALRNAGHLGRIGQWPQNAAEAGLVSLHFVNTSGGGILVAPFGGIDRRLSANPIAAGVPLEGELPLVLDISTCTIAEGKIRVAFNAGKQVPTSCIIDAQGQPTCDPHVFYADPPGAILTMAGHKGYGLSILTEVLAGALTGGGCSATGVQRVANGMLSIYLDPQRFAGEAFESDLARFVKFVKSSRVSVAGQEILLPGELEQRTKLQRMRDGIELDEMTWQQLVDTAGTLGVRADDYQPA
jgi:uncharacterized oxidoreductase